MTLGVTALTSSACTSTEVPLGAPNVGATSGTGAAAATGSPSTPVSTTSDPKTEAHDAVAALFAQRAAAMVAKDKGAWLGSLADTGSPFAAAQASLFDRLVGMPVSGLTARQLSLTDAAAADTVVANVKLGYRFTGYDQGDRSFAASYLVSRTSAGWRLVGPGPGPTNVQPFDLDGATTLSTPGTLVIGDVPLATLQAYQALGEAARGPIGQAWGQARPAVIVAPASGAELEAQLGRGSVAGLDQVAAITDGPLPSGEPAQSDRVYLNPDAMGRLSTDGRRVVITHELTHVTVRGSTTRRVPIWLSEGYADEVAFADSALPPKTVAADLLALVRDGAGPSTLPTASDFDPAKGTIAPMYSAAWLAVQLIRDQHGAGRLTDFYRAVSGGPTPDPAVTAAPDELTRQAFTSVLGVSQDAFVADWTAYLTRLAA